MNCLSITFSIALFFTVALCYNASCPTCYPPSNPYWTIQRLLQDPVFYLLCTITPVAALLPRYFYRACHSTLFPNPVQVGRQLDKLPADTRRNILSLRQGQDGVVAQPQTSLSARRQTPELRSEGSEEQTGSCPARRCRKRPAGGRSRELHQKRPSALRGAAACLHQRPFRLRTLQRDDLHPCGGTDGQGAAEPAPQQNLTVRGIREEFRSAAQP
ncbi:hypothetical protein OJAV_G00037460 [Oryzias javanicus]|uniref:P-type ATPase C-terminal domain-containing protein n=1 Tax=Oryzias javanicus TaxID=123683 RepID=A0A437DGD5_ORYJA|nr:hypothetical protein OJAV_G00037460 [Oryzias javanicus]